MAKYLVRSAENAQRSFIASAVKAGVSSLIDTDDQSPCDSYP
jgi:hypothetical protein